MPTLQRFNQCRVVIYLNDHPPPHVHIKLRDSRDCTVDLETFIITGQVDEREIREALIWIRSEQVSLLKKWREFH
ncbi:hypothetical protein CKO09_04245 [Chromatium weissei]|nr:hypothetical protein [Chromatium weissei]